MEAARATARESTPTGPPGSEPAPAGPSPASGPTRLEPDLDFIRTIRSQTGETFKKCFQCGTCSSTCELSPDSDPFPRKEMAWAVWGLKDRLLSDPDVWLCHQCNDCSTRCPRGARPGDVMAAVRREAILQYAVPRFLARWVRHPKYIPLLLAIPATLLAVTLTLRDPLESALGITRYAEGRISYSFSSELPHWLLNGFFGLFGLLALTVMGIGVVRFWRGMKAGVPAERLKNPARGVGESLWVVIKKLFLHERFTRCKSARPRYASHLLVFFGFLALTAVTLWVITSRFNPLITDEFVYPFNFWNPWKLLANAGGLALLLGLSLMIRDRFRDRERVAGTYFDWSLILLLLFVVLTGFATEAMHFARMEPHRHTIYFFHLVLIFALLIYLPYSKLAHIVYRTAAMVFAEHAGREVLRGTDQAGERSESGEGALGGSAGEGGRWAP